MAKTRKRLEDLPQNTDLSANTKQALDANMYIMTLLLTETACFLSIESKDGLNQDPNWFRISRPKKR